MSKTLPHRDRWIALALIASMIVTRGVHADHGVSLPDTSLAAFALAGWWITSRGAFISLCAAAFVIDLAAVTAGGVGASCSSWAYPFLVPAYGCLWIAGRFVQRESISSGAAIRALAVYVPASAVLSYAISSLSYYAFELAGRGTLLSDYVARAWTYGAQAVGWTIVYAAFGTALAAAFGAFGPAGAVARPPVE